MLMPNIEKQQQAVPLFDRLKPLAGLRASAELDALLPSILDMLLSSDSLSTDKESFDRKIL